MHALSLPCRARGPARLVTSVGQHSSIRRASRSMYLACRRVHAMAGASIIDHRDSAAFLRYRDPAPVNAKHVFHEPNCRL